MATFDAHLPPGSFSFFPAFLEPFPFELFLFCFVKKLTESFFRVGNFFPRESVEKRKGKRVTIAVAVNGSGPAEGEIEGWSGVCFARD